ncbi:acetyl-CoA carboxylase biotin carboxyl carrier protein [Marinicrinis lubricantis]|uniref:Biotin carboxyl carrier protein of acetyl-CoA carboxylase n=1 Tax=Marinicrinis lubricantis TaxID=2086470 RepID=A0ABW1IRM4_9BACL
MYKLNEIKELIKLVNQSDIQELEIENEGSRLLIRKPGKTESIVIPSAPSQPAFAPAVPAQQPVVQQQPETAPAAEKNTEAAAQESGQYHQITSPMVGTFYASPSPNAAPFVSKGDKVDEKTVVCIVEAMKLMNEIEAEVKGEIVEILVENGQLVEYGQPLFKVKAQ